MSSDRPTGGPSREPDGTPVDPGFISLVRLRGAPLIDALDERIPGSRERAEATGSYAFAAAAGLGLDRIEAELCRETAKLHDIGKLYVPRAVLERDVSELNGQERTLLESHHEAGARVARGAGIPEVVCGWILSVRERFDGQGPEGLAGTRIPMASRVARAAHACDIALVELRKESEYSAAVAWAAIERLRDSAGRELDPDAVEALAELLGVPA
jgi:putative nucleotidyltransferase with HDIG domain